MHLTRNRLIKKKNDSARIALFFLLLGAAIGLLTNAADAQVSSPEKRRASQAGLSSEQRQIQREYKAIERRIDQLARDAVGQDVSRAQLLKSVLAASRNKRILSQFETLVSSLKAENGLKTSIRSQQDLHRDLLVVLKLLQNENRDNSVRKEKERLQALLRELNILLRQQQGLRGQNEGGENSQKIAKQQKELADKTRELRNNSDPSKPAKGAASGDLKSKEPSSPGKKGQPVDGGEPSPTRSAARKHLEEAERNMREALKKLAQQKRQGSVQDQQKAIDNLRRAKARLEKILRQLRDEEIVRMLTSLENRFQKMRKDQQLVNKKTKTLSAVAVDRRDQYHARAAGKLGHQQDAIGQLCLRTVQLLREDGTALAMLEASTQLHDDMKQISERIAGGQVDSLTQDIEEEVILQLDDILAALKQAQQDMDDRQRDSAGQPKNGSMTEPPLVDKLAELKMIRAMQVRVQRRHTRYAKRLQQLRLIPDPRARLADEQELKGAVRALAERQYRVYQITSDIVKGINE